MRIAEENCANIASNAASGYGRSVGGGDLETDIGERPLFGNRHAALERLLFATPFRVVHAGDAASVADSVAWWEELTGRGGDGMVVKPGDFVARNAKGRLVQPTLKCRGRVPARVHECVFGVLALESEPVDPRL